MNFFIFKKTKKIELKLKMIHFFPFLDPADYFDYLDI